jgi:membrane protease YdiL (CAAX protease family)
MARLGDGRRVLAITVIATLAMATFITVRLGLQILEGDALDRVAGQFLLVIALVAVAGSASTGLGVLRWREERGRRRAIRGAIAMAIYLGVLGGSLEQLYMLVLAAAFGVGAYLGQTRKPAAVDQA